MTSEKSVSPSGNVRNPARVVTGKKSGSMRSNAIISPPALTAIKSGSMLSNAINSAPAMTSEKSAQSGKMPANASIAKPEKMSTNVNMNVPGSKRRRSYQRNLAKARKAIESGELQPSVRPVAVFCQCGGKTAMAILAELVSDGVLNRDTRGRVSVA